MSTAKRHSRPKTTPRRSSDRCREQPTPAQSVQDEILQLIANGGDLAQTLQRVVSLIDLRVAPAICTIIATDRIGRPIYAHGPTVPLKLVRALDEARAAPDQDCWNSPKVRERARVSGFQAIRSQAIIATDGNVLGTLYLLEPASGPRREIHNAEIKRQSALATIAIERDRSAQALRSADERFASLAASVPGVVYQRRVGPDGDIRYTYISEGVRDLFGVSPDEVLKDPNALFQQFDPSYASKFRERLKQASESLAMWDVEASIVSRDGQHKFTHAIARPYKQRDGSVLWNGLILDNTRIKRAEMAAAAAEARSREAILESLPQGLTFFDPSDRLMMCNGAYLTLYPALKAIAVPGASYEALIGAEIACSALTSDLQERRRQARLERHGRSHHSLEVQLPDQRWILISERRSADGGTVALHTDITRLKQREAERTRLQDELFRSQKMESMGRLAGGIAHDFNNLLAAILGNAGFLVEDLPPDSELRDFAQQIVTAGQRAKHLVQQILAFSRRQSPEQEALNPRDLINEATQLLRTAVPASISLNVRPYDGEATIRGNATQLVQVLMNLCVNARDAIGEKHGEINLEMQLIEPEDPARQALQGAVAGRAVQLGDGGAQIVTASLTPNQRYLRLQVRDTGCGMDARTMEKMFEPFFTTKEVGKGTGLGLAAVHGIVAAHGGVVAVRSRPGDGTAFDVFLPVVAVQSSVSGREAASAKPTGSESVFIVDDEKQVSSTVARALNRLGYKVECFSSGADALKAWRGQPGAWSLAITDHTMPEMTGLELAQQILKERPDFPVILCSGLMDTESADAAAAAGIKAVLAKPVDQDTLARTIRDLLDRRAA